MSDEALVIDPDNPNLAILDGGLVIRYSRTGGTVTMSPSPAVAAAAERIEWAAFMVVREGEQ